MRMEAPEGKKNVIWSLVCPSTYNGDRQVQMGAPADECLLMVDEWMDG